MVTIIPRMSNLPKQPHSRERIECVPFSFLLPKFLFFVVGLGEKIFDETMGLLGWVKA